MRRRHGTLVVMLAASIGLASGCVTLMGQRLPSPDSQVTYEAPPATESAAVASHIDSPSPYQVTTVAPVRTIEPPPPLRPPDAQVQPAAAPTPSAAGTGSTQSVLLTTPPDPPLVASLRELLANHTSEARALLSQYDRRDQDLLRAMLALAARLVEEKDRSAGAETPALNEARRALAAALKARAALDLGAVCFCTEVKAFGVYKPKLPVHAAPMESSLAEPVKTAHKEKDLVEYQPGEPMKLYIEVRDFYSQPQDDGFETRLAATVDIHNMQNDPVVPPIHLSAFADRSRAPRQDYFIVLTIPVPARLPQGKYTLWLTVRDETPPPPEAAATCRNARRSLDFCVVDHPGLPSEARARRSSE